jgi:hypothetical protein
MVPRREAGKSFEQGYPHPPDEQEKPMTDAKKTVAKAPAKKTADKPAAAAKPTATKPAAAKKPASNAARKATKLEVTPEQRHFMIAEAAYYRAERRGFEGGYEWQDWMDAEAEIDRLITGKK